VSLDGQIVLVMAENRNISTIWEGSDSFLREGASA
jgi:hypothetical protein